MLEVIVFEGVQNLALFGAQDQGGYLGIYQRLVQPVHKGATLT